MADYDNLDNTLLSLFDGLTERDRHLLCTVFKIAGATMDISVSRRSAVREWFEPSKLLQAVSRAHPCSPDEPVNRVFGTIAKFASQAPSATEMPIVFLSGGLRSSVHLAALVSRQTPFSVVYVGERESAQAVAVRRLCSFFGASLMIVSSWREASELNSRRSRGRLDDTVTLSHPNSGNPFNDYSAEFLARVASRLRLPLSLIYCCENPVGTCGACFSCREFEHLLRRFDSDAERTNPSKADAPLKGRTSDTLVIPVLVVGRPFSGSTVLGMALGAHAQILNVGELAKLPELVLEGALCSCGVEYAECPFWNKYLRLLPSADLGRDHSSTADIRSQRWMAVLDAISADTGRRFIIDTSKDPLRAKSLLARASSAKIIHLVRSPNAAVASDQKYRGIDWPADRTLSAWCSTHQYILDTFGSMGAAYHRIRYEDLVGDPETELSACLQFMGLAERRMAAVFLPGHQVGGNPIRSSEQTFRNIEDQDRCTWGMNADQLELCAALGYPSST